jgi:diguanylate cyclase (GGDEF)-like protein
MSVDVNTLFLLTVDIEAILGLLLLFVWVQNIGQHAVAWWGFAHLVRSLSVVLYGMYGSLPNLVSIDLANALLFTSYAITWNGARVFNGRDPRYGSLLAGAIVWTLADRVPGFSAATDVQTVLSAGIVTTFIWLTAYEFWRGRAERLVSRWPAIFILLLHGTAFLLRTPLTLFLQEPEKTELLASAWTTVISVEALLAAVSLALVLVAMAKERMELSYKTAALHDPLTGLANRRAFMDRAAELIERQVQRDRPVGVFMIDLDRFKSINDRFGHAVGDSVLEIFAETTRTHLRGSDLVGRLGGEEFAVVVADACRDNAFRVADRLRAAFAEAAAVVEKNPVGATASVGVSIIQDPTQDVAALLVQADKALYAAKTLGGNAVVLAEPEAIEDVDVEAMKVVNLSPRATTDGKAAGTTRSGRARAAAQ